MDLMTLKKDLSPQQMQMVEMEYRDKKKDKTIMIVLWLFFAGLGGHRFYMGDKGYAVAMLFLGWLTFLIWPLIDIVFALRRLDDINEQTQKRLIMEVKVLAPKN